MKITPGRVFASAVVALVLTPAVTHAQICGVPTGSHPTAQDAVNDSGCATVSLGNLTYSESLLVRRSLTISGPPTVAEVAGYIKVEGNGNLVVLNNIKVQNGCTPAAMEVNPGAQITPSNVEVAWTSGGPCPRSTAILFESDFETGNTSDWAATVP